MKLIDKVNIERLQKDFEDYYRLVRRKGGVSTIHLNPIIKEWSKEEVEKLYDYLKKVYPNTEIYSFKFAQIPFDWKVKS